MPVQAKCWYAARDEPLMSKREARITLTGPKQTHGLYGGHSFSHEDLAPPAGGCLVASGPSRGVCVVDGGDNSEWSGGEPELAGVALPQWGVPLLPI